MFVQIAFVASALFPLVSAVPLPTFSIMAALTVIPNLSSNCSTAVQNVLMNPDASCLNAAALISLASATTGASVVPIVDSWAQGMCRVLPCSSNFMFSMADNISTHCLADINSVASKYALSPYGEEDVRAGIQAFYPTMRNITCLKDITSTPAQFCPTQLLTELQSKVGTIEASNLFTVFQDATPVLTAPNNNIACSACTQVAYSMLNTTFPVFVDEQKITQELDGICSAGRTGFTDNAKSALLLTNVTETALKPKSGAMRLSMTGPAVVVTIATLIGFLV